MIVCDYQSDMAFRVLQHFISATWRTPELHVHRTEFIWKTGVDPQNAPISVPHPWADLADPLKTLRWPAGDPRGAKGLKETCSGAEDDKVEEEEVEEEEEEGVRSGRGEALVTL